MAMFRYPAAFLALLLAPALVAQTADPAKSALVLLSGTDCTLSLDGEKAADLRADEPVRLEVPPGDYVLSAVAGDGRRWSRVLRVEGAKTIVQVEFSTSTAPSTAAPPAAAVSARPGPVPTPAPAAPAARPIGSPGFTWITIPAGEFEMGCSQGDEECNPAEMPLRHARVGNVGGQQQQIVQLGLQLALVWLELLQFSRDGAALRDGSLARRFVWPGVAHGLREPILLGAQLIGAAAGGAQLIVERQQRIHIDGGLAAARDILHQIRMLADERDVQHGKLLRFLSGEGAIHAQPTTADHQIAWRHAGPISPKNNPKQYAAHRKGRAAYASWRHLCSPDRSLPASRRAAIAG